MLDRIRRRVRARDLALVLALVLLVSNLGFVLWHQRLSGSALLAPAAGSSAQTILAIAVSEGLTLTATSGNVVALWQKGQLAQQRQFPTTVTSIAADERRLYVGSSDGSVSVLDRTLQPLRTLRVDGSVVALAVRDDGGLLIGHGIGAFSDRYFVSFVPPDSNAAASSVNVGFTLSSLDALGATALYGTLNARVGAIVDSASAAPHWTVTVRQPVSSLLAIPEREQLLAGDERGNLALISTDGTIVGQLAASQYRIRALGYDDANGLFLVGDARGDVYALDTNGQPLVTRQVASDVAAILPGSGGMWTIVPRDGAWQTLDPAAVRNIARAGQVRAAWTVVNAGLLTLLALALALAVPRVRLALRHTARQSWRGRSGYLFMLPALLLIGLFSYYPAALAVYSSFTNYSLGAPVEFIGVRNYVQILTNDFYFRIGLINMLIITVFSVIKIITVPLLVAELVFWLQNTAHQYAFRTLFVLPTVVPGIVFTLLWRHVYDPRTGLLNELLATLGLGQFQRTWLGDPDTALWAVIAVGFPYVDAFAFLILLGGLLNINPEYYDAARVDGATSWSRFWNIDLALLRPQFRILLFFAITGTVQGFAGIFILTNGGPGYATYVPALEMYQRIAQGDLGYASAIGVLLLAMIVVATVIILRWRRQEGVETA